MGTLLAFCLLQLSSYLWYFPRFLYLDLHLCKGQDWAKPRPSLKNKRRNFPPLAVGYMELLPGAGFCLTIYVALRRSGGRGVFAVSAELRDVTAAWA